MKELSTEERVEILDRIHNTDNAQAEAMSCVADYDKLDDDTLFDLLGISGWSDIPAEPWPEDEPALPAQKKRGPKPGTKKNASGGGRTMNEPKKCTTAKPAGQAVAAPLLTPEECSAAAEYLTNTLTEWIRAGALEGTWQLADLRNLLNAQHKLQLMGDGTK